MDSLPQAGASDSEARTFKTDEFRDNGKLFEAYQQNLFCDVVLVAGDKK